MRQQERRSHGGSAPLACSLWAKSFVVCSPQLSQVIRNLRDRLYDSLATSGRLTFLLFNIARDGREEIAPLIQRANSRLSRLIFSASLVIKDN